MERSTGGAGRSPNKKRVLIADDHELAREGMRAVLGSIPWVNVVGEARNGREAVELTETLRPDLVVMDIRMPDLDGLQATAEIKKVAPNTSVIMVTMHENPEYLLEALRVGASGYLLKESSSDQVRQTIQSIFDGGESLSSRAVSGLLTQMMSKGASQQKLEMGETLTPREREVLVLVAAGRTNREIAATLIISPGTAKQHVERIIGKLGVSDRTQAAVKAIQLGLVSSSGQG